MQGLGWGTATRGELGVQERARAHAAPGWELNPAVRNHDRARLGVEPSRSSTICTREAGSRERTRDKTSVAREVWVTEGRLADRPGRIALYAHVIVGGTRSERSDKRTSFLFVSLAQAHSHGRANGWGWEVAEG